LYDVKVSCHPKILVVPMRAPVTKNGLKCVTACGDCHEEGCNNSKEIVLDSEETSSTNAESIFNT